jgi:predicted CoA-binding protein
LIKYVKGDSLTAVLFYLKRVMAILWIYNCLIEEKIMPDDHIEQEKEINEETLLRSMGIMVPRHRIVHVESEAEKKDPNKKAAASKYENIARRVKEIWQQHGFGPGEDQRAWHGVLADIKSMITPLPDIEKTRSKIKRVSPAERSKPNQSETETTPELTHELAPEQAEQIDQQREREPGEDQQSRTETEGSDVNKNETEASPELVPELTHEFIDDPAKEIWEQSEYEFVEDQQNQIEAEGLDVDNNETETMPELVPELTYELIAERAKQIWLQHGCRPGEDQQNWADAEAQLKAELNID